MPHPQVDKSSYQPEAYADLARFSSYYCQIRELLHTEPASILEIGVGDGVVAGYLRRHTTIAYTTADVAEDLSPDIVADIRSLPFKDASFDTVCAFEVLEHIPFEDFEKGVSELFRVARGHVVVSLPHFGPPFKLLLKVPFVPELKIAWKFPFPKEHRFNGQHYWEIGKKDYPPMRIRNVLSAFGRIEAEFVPFENQYHHFFRIEKHGR